MPQALWGRAPQGASGGEICRLLESRARGCKIAEDWQKRPKSSNPETSFGPEVSSYRRMLEEG
eukprot:5040716-Pyramimonas_sp.AAC.1